MLNLHFFSSGMDRSYCGKMLEAAQISMYIWAKAESCIATQECVNHKNFVVTRSIEEVQNAVERYHFIIEKVFLCSSLNRDRQLHKMQVVLHYTQLQLMLPMPGNHLIAIVGIFDRLVDFQIEAVASLILLPISC